MDDGLQGKVPELQAAMDLYHILSESDTHLRQPVALETQLFADQDMDDDVGYSMLQLLQVRCVLSQQDADAIRCCGEGKSCPPPPLPPFVFPTSPHVPSKRLCDGAGAVSTVVVCESLGPVPRFAPSSQ